MQTILGAGGAIGTELVRVRGAALIGSPNVATETRLDMDSFCSSPLSEFEAQGHRDPPLIKMTISKTY